MSNAIKCFDVVTMVTDEATSQFSPCWKVDEEKKKILKQYCSVIDSLSEENDGVAFQVDVDEITMTISIKMECISLFVPSPDHDFYKLAQRAISVGFSQSEDVNLIVEFVFPSIWEKAI